VLHNTPHTSTVLRGPVHTVDQHLYLYSAKHLKRNAAEKIITPHNPTNPIHPTHPSSDNKHTTSTYPFPIPLCRFGIFCKKSTHSTSIFYKIYQNNVLYNCTFGNDISFFVRLFRSVTERGKKKISTKKKKKTTERKTQSTE